MKSLLLHYWLINHRGGEKVLEALAEILPEADILTHVYDKHNFDNIFSDHKVFCTFINSLPRAKSWYQKYLLLMPLAQKRIDLSEYDLLVSSESGPIKGINKPASATHICYCHTPMRYVWDMYEEYRQKSGTLTRLVMSLSKNYLRNYDRKSADQVDHFIANSAFVAERIKRIYNRESTVIHPPVNTTYFSEKERQEQDFFLYAGELCSYKRPDIVIDAFISNGRKLVLAGCGSETEVLKKRATGHDNITFAGRVSNDRLRELFSTCKALIFPGVEDFGIIPIEVQAAGAPVIAYRCGGALETVIEKETGLFFDQQNGTSLLNAIEEFESMKFCTNTIREHAHSFSADCFKQQMKDYFTQHIPGYVK